MRVATGLRNAHMPPLHVRDWTLACRETCCGLGSNPKHKQTPKPWTAFSPKLGSKIHDKHVADHVPNPVALVGLMVTCLNACSTLSFSAQYGCAS